MKHHLVCAALLLVLLIVMIHRVAPDPYVYDEADYMYAASLGFGANYTDSPTLPIADFVRTGLTVGGDASQRQALSEQIRASDDVVFYRHWHGPLDLYLLIPLSRLRLNERQVRTAMLAIPALTLAVIYGGCLWTIPGVLGTYAALLAGILFLSSNAVIGSLELAPHQLFALISVCFLFLIAKFVTTGRPIFWYSAVAAAALAFCTLEVAFVLILTLLVCGYRERHQIKIFRSIAVFIATVLVVWPAAIYKLSFLKGYLFMAYLAVFRKSPWGHEGFFETWQHRILDSPLEWAAILAGLIIYFRTSTEPQKRAASPFLIYSVLMLLATARVLSSTARYSLLFMPSLDIFAAFALTPHLAALPRRALFAPVALFGLAFGIAEYRLYGGHRNPDPRPPAVLNYIRHHELENSALLVPQDDLPMIHYYFPRTHLRGYYGATPAADEMQQFAPDRILYTDSR